jgi:hypothetical protein
MKLTEIKSLFAEVARCGGHVSKVPVAGLNDEGRRALEAWLDAESIGHTEPHRSQGSWALDVVLPGDAP